MTIPRASKHAFLLSPALIALAFMLNACVSGNELRDKQTTGLEQDQAAELNEYVRISAAEAKEMIDNEEVIIVDVRTQAEYEEVRIEGALLIPDYEIADAGPDLLPDKDAVILVYCRSGRRSENASRILIDLGYLNVFDFGGIIDWPYETVSGSD